MPDPRGTGFGPAQVRRHRFVQDGEVPVTVVRARLDHAADAAGPAAAQPVNRLASLQAALTAEQCARERAERGLADATVQIRDLQTKIAHLEMARSEQQAQLQALAEERRQMAEAHLPDDPAADHAYPPETLPPKAKRGRPRRVVVDEPEPEPVKWWLGTTQKGFATDADEDDFPA